MANWKADTLAPLTPIYLTLKGIPSETPPTSELFFWLDAQGAWRPSVGDLSGDIEVECLRLHDAFAAAIFGSLGTYYSFLPSAPEFVFSAGLNSESTLKCTDFESFLHSSKDLQTTNKLLYLADCRKLVTSIQECTKEVLFLQGEFYRALNLDPLFYPPMDEEDGMRWMTSPVVTNIHATLSFVFIRMHSLLDYTTKVAFEAENLRTNFSTYPRLASGRIIFGDRKRLGINQAPGTLFEVNEVVSEIELYRNHVIHDGLLDDMPKVYKVVESGQTTEKFVLLPDRGTEGRFEKYNNRNLFYSREDRINLRLPQFIAAFQERQVTTLKAILSFL